MLVDLKIENFGIIEQVRFRPGTGLNILTGETGSGKSLVLQAVDAVLGSRVASGMVRHGAERATIEAVYDISQNSELKSRLTDHSFPSEDLLTIKREIPVEGKGRLFINGNTTSMNVLKSIATSLMEIHGQHEHQRLFDPDSHLESLDLFAGTCEKRERVAELYHRYTNLQKRLKCVTLETGERERRLDYLKFALDEIEEFEPVVGEFEELQNKKGLYQNSGRVYRDLAVACSLLREEEHSILDLLYTVERSFESVVTYLPDIEESQSMFRDSIYAIEAVTDTLRKERDRLQFSPEELETIDERISGYMRLHKKYGGTTESILKKKDEYIREISSIELSNEESEILLSDLQIIETEMHELAEDLSRRRRSVIPVLEEKISSELNQLGMQGAAIQIRVRRDLDTSSDTNFSQEEMLKDEGRTVNRRYLINEKGLDRVEFLLRANQGESLQLLRKVASGGELSRITLAIKSVIIEARPLQSVIFDEIDSGVGGEVAHTIAARLKDLSKRGQVIAVTHLHQIASSADHHFRIQKSVLNDRTTTHILRLGGEERMLEMARMLGGDRPGPVVLEHARELLARSSAG